MLHFVLSIYSPVSVLPTFKTRSAEICLISIRSAELAEKLTLTTKDVNDFCIESIMTDIGTYDGGFDSLDQPPSPFRTKERVELDEDFDRYGLPVTE